jgi:C-terminal processing protease CtpA/Prc
LRRDRRRGHEFSFSGGEEFSNDLKVLKRATLVGEVPGGGVAVEPDVKVPAADALTIAQALAAKELADRRTASKP